MTAPQTAMQVAQQLAHIARELDLAVKELAHLDENAVRAKCAYETALAHAFLSIDGGTIPEREHRATLSTAEEKLAWKLADQKLRAQRSYIESLKERIDVGRSYASAIKAEIGLAHSGMAS